MPSYHVVLYAVYAPGPTLVATLLDNNNNPPVLNTASFIFSINGVPGHPIPGLEGLASIPLTLPLCNAIYAVSVSYTVFDSFTPLSSSDQIVVGADYIINDVYITQNITPGTVVLGLFPGLVATYIQWYYNYGPIYPANPTSFVATYNGIYEVEIYDGATGLILYAATEVTQAQAASYIKITGNDGNIYGALGTPQTVQTLTFTVTDPNSQYRYQVYVNGVQVSNGPVLTITNLVAGDTIVVVVTDCCGIQLTANTYILPCTVAAPVLT